MVKRSYTKEEFARILATARTLQTQNLILEGIAALDEVDLDTICQLAGDEGISRDYIEKAQQILYPNFQERLKLIDEKRIGLNLKWVVKLYHDELLEQLRFIAPEQEFSANVNLRKDWEENFNWAGIKKNLYFYRMESKEGIFCWRKRKVELANLEIQQRSFGEDKSFDLNVYLSDEFFLRACQEKLDSINDYFRGKKEFHLDVYHVYIG